MWRIVLDQDLAENRTVLSNSGCVESTKSTAHLLPLRVLSEWSACFGPPPPAPRTPPAPWAALYPHVDHQNTPPRTRRQVWATAGGSSGKWLQLVMSQEMMVRTQRKWSFFQFSPLLPERAAAAKRSENTRRCMIVPARTPRTFHSLCTSSKEVAAAAAFWLNQDKPGSDVLLSAGSLLAKLHSDCKQFMAAQWAIMLH